MLKPLERHFFKYVVKQINYENTDTVGFVASDIIGFIKPMNEIIEQFSENNNCRTKPLQ